MKKSIFNKTNKDYPLETAGRRMITTVPIVRPNQTITEIELMLLEKIKEFETINYIYVVNEEKKLVGVISIKELFRSSKDAVVEEIMKRELVTVRPHIDQERVAVLAIKHNLKAIPVVAHDNIFLGVVPSDTILDILHQEQIEDILLSAGIRKFKEPVRSLIFAPAKTHFKKRIFWLVLGLAGGIIAAFVVSSFEESLKTYLILAAFIPAVVYMADAVGSQTQTIFIRSLAIEEKLNFKKYLQREIRVGLLLALVLGVIMFFFSFFWQKVLLFGLILGISFFATIIVAMAVAIFLPWLFLKIKYDPAVASGPFATIIRDILSLLIYFVVASIIFSLYR